MTSPLTNSARAFAFIALGLAIAAMGIYVAGADDAPGAAVIGFLLMIAAVIVARRPHGTGSLSGQGAPHWRPVFSLPRSRHFSPTRSR